MISPVSLRAWLVVRVLKVFRDGPLEKLWGEEGNFQGAGIFLLSNSLYDFFLGHSMNIFLGLIGVHEFFFI